MKLTNSEIYTYTQMMLNAFQDGQQKLPIKINFYLQKNKQTLIDLTQEIEKTRMEIAQSYGTLDESGDQYSIPPEKIEEASKELEDLFALEQEVNIYKINIDTLPDDMVFTAAQMEAIMFMID